MSAPTTNARTIINMAKAIDNSYCLIFKPDKIYDYLLSLLMEIADPLSECCTY